MSGNEPDILDNLDQFARNWSGDDTEGQGAQNLLENFHLFGHAKRSEMLDEFDGKLKDADTSNIGRYARVTNLRRKMGHIHHELIKARK